LGSSLDDKSKERSWVGRRPCRRKSLCSSSLVFRSFSLAYACSSIAIREAPISSMRRAWLKRVSSWRRSWLAQASSRIRSYSRRYSSFSSWRALMVSIICCKTGTSPSPYPSSPALVFLITSEGLVVNMDGIRFYRALRWEPNVLASWLRSVSEMSSALTCLHVMLWYVDHTPTIKSLRAFKL